MLNIPNWLPNRPDATAVTTPCSLRKENWIRRKVAIEHVGLPSHDEINLAPVYWVWLGLFVGSRAHWPRMLGPLSAFVRPHFGNKLELGWFGFSQTFWNQFLGPWLHALPNLTCLESYASCKQRVTHAQVACESPAFGHFDDACNGTLGSRSISDSSSVYTQNQLSHRIDNFEQRSLQPM